MKGILVTRKNTRRAVVGSNILYLIRISNIFFGRALLSFHLLFGLLGLCRVLFITITISIIILGAYLPCYQVLVLGAYRIIIKWF